MPRLESLIPLLVCALLLPAAIAAEPPQPRQPNAALLYWVAFAARSSNDAQEKILTNWKSVPFDAATLLLLESNASSFRYLRRGAAIRHCDWGLPLDEGLTLLLPHLAKARDLGRLAALRARYDLENARSEAAVDDIADLFTLARHAGSDNLLIALLVQYSIESTAIDVTADHLLALDAPSRARLAARLRDLPAASRIEDCVGTEKEFAHGYLVKALKTADPKSDWIEKIFVSTGVMTADDARSAVAAAGGTPESVLKSLNDLEPFYDRMAKVLALPPDQFPAAFDALKKEFEANPMGNKFLAYFIKPYNVSARARARFAMLQAAIAVSLDGPEKLRDFPDPAGGGVFKHRPLARGFELESAAIYENKPVVLVVH